MKLNPEVVAKIRRIMADYFPIALLESAPETTTIADVFRLAD